MADNRSGQWAVERNRRVFVVAETTYGTAVKPTSTDMIATKTGGGISDPVPNRVERDDSHISRSLEANISGSTPPIPWTFEGYLIPSGTAGTPPDVHLLLLAAMGISTYTNTGSTSDQYLLSDVAKDLGSLSIYEGYPAGIAAAEDYLMMKSLHGAFVDTMTIKGSGGDPPAITFAGRGARHVLTARDTINGAPSGATVTASNVENFEVDSLVAFYEAADGTTEVDSNSSTGWSVSSISGSVLTLEGSPSGHATTDIIAPWGPTVILVGDPIPGVQATVAVGGVSAAPLEYEVTLDNGNQAHDNEVGQQVTTGYHEGKRRVTGFIKFRALSSDMKILTGRRLFANRTIVLTLGTAGGSICTITVEAELGFADIERSEEETVIVNLPFKGVATGSTLKNELVILFT